MTTEHTITPPVATKEGRRVGGWSPILTVRLIQIALWLVVVSGPIVAVLALGEVDALRNQIAAVEASSQTEPVDTTEAEGLALVAVADHLTGTGWAVAGTAIVAVNETSPGVLAVTVAAHITPLTADADPAEGDAAADPEAAAVRRLFFSVALADTGEGWVTTGTPALVTGPAVEVVAGTARRDRLDATPGLEDTVVRFLAAYLTGDGDVERYTAPDTSLQAVSPAPFTTVEVSEAGSIRDPDGSLQVTVTVEGTDPSGQSMTVGYTLTVIERDGRFEVARLLPPLPSPTADPAHPRQREGGLS